MAAEPFRGCFKRHTRLRRLFSDGENVSQVCGDFFRMAQKACMPAGTFFGWRKRHACLQELFSDCAKGMHAYGNIFRKVKCCSVFPGAKDSVCYVRLMSSSEGRKSRRIHGPPDRRTITWPYSRVRGNLTYCVECCALTF